MAIKIGKVVFPHNVFCATGARGSFGEGYWYHFFLKFLGLSWRQTNFTAKTMTIYPHKGNLPLAENGISPKELLPRCIVLHLQSGHIVNAVGLAGLGARFLLRQGSWQKLTQPFVLSFMAVSKTHQERRKEYETFVRIFKQNSGEFKAPFVLQVDYGCPNVGLSLDDLYDEIVDSLKILSGLGVPLVPNFSPLVPASLLLELEKTGLCTGFWIANTIPYDHDGLGESIFGQKCSPLLKRGFPSAGGISGPRCLRYTLKTVADARAIGVTLPIVAGNGIRTPKDVQSLKNAGANGIPIGSVAMFPQTVWRMRDIINTANQIMGG